MFDENTKQSAMRAFIRSRIQLMQSRPFWAHLVMKMPLEWTDITEYSCTDGTTLFINPTGYLKLTKGEQVACLVHEVLHCVAHHLTRCGSRDANMFNIAGDIYIANTLAAERFESIKVSEELFQQMKINRADYAKLTTEAIYDKLPKPQKGKGGCLHWQGKGGCYREQAGATSASRSMQEQQWRQAVIEAGQLAGNEPGVWQELVKAAMPKPPFHVPLLDFLNRGMSGDTDWSLINRRYLWRGLYLPQEYTQVMGEIVVAVDTSGSMDTATQLTEAFGYIRTFREEHACRLHLIQCDHNDVNAGQYVCYEEHERLPETFKVIGRGGTSFDPPFKLVGERRIEPRVMIYLTDGLGTCTMPRPNYEVMWVILGGDKNFKPPFGDVIFVD